jgi:hypothetical protein
MTAEDVHRGDAGASCAGRFQPARKSARVPWVGKKSPRPFPAVEGYRAAVPHRSDAHRQREAVVRQGPVAVPASHASDTRRGDRCHRVLRPQRGASGPVVVVGVRFGAGVGARRRTRRVHRDGCRTDRREPRTHHSQKDPGQRVRDVHGVQDARPRVAVAAHTVARGPHRPRSGPLRGGGASARREARAAHVRGFVQSRQSESAGVSVSGRSGVAGARRFERPRHAHRESGDGHHRCHGRTPAPLAVQPARYDEVLLRPRRVA